MNTCQNPVCHKLFVVKPGTHGKYCSLSCGTSHRNQKTLINNLVIYNNNPLYCKGCNNILPYNSRANIFCNHSCSATYNNPNRNYSSFNKICRQKIKYTKINQCVICNKFHPGTRKTCSTQCFSKHHSNQIQKAIKNGFNPSLNRGRGKQSYLESSFEQWLILNNILNYESEKHFYNSENRKNYYVDFFFSSLNFAIELDGSQHNNTVMQDTIRDNYLNSVGIEVLRISHKDYQNKTYEKFILDKLK